ncbi:DNA polymerase III subunit beta [Helicobacter brantae]|uniref:Beta sliding clamp n=1 Tax=Helicobacter brantae TaxID=375927 RepID=A0A3D8J2M5_9HELI|nr:DNA polymerase III subunit beta [Helicobacter brantae]RDU71395.1 DNA polymerase III subunit beta [Helicobacter brantae]
MKITLSKYPLENILANFQSFLDKRDQSQITSHIFFQVQGNHLLLRATDFEMGIQSKIEISKVEQEGTGTVNGKKILDIIKQLKDGKEITFETNDDNLIIKQEKAKFKLPMFNADEFPSFPQYNQESKINIPSSNFIEAIKKISPAVGVNNPKIELNGAHLDMKEYEINFVATDTRRLALVRLETQSISTLSIIIPKRALGEITKLFIDELSIYFNESQLIFETGNYAFFTKLTNGRFPDYERIIPKNINHTFTLSKSKFVESLRIINSISQDVKMTFDNGVINFESMSNENSEANTQCEAQIQVENPVMIAANSKSILDFLGQMDGENFEFCISEPNLPFMIKDKNFSTIVMPINL